ncbi:MAG: GGDEF domain-containing protein, partial [Eubacteriales bacterium]|nr:GGDEF domain-containing protein [Eubacteriales bacterium]
EKSRKETFLYHEKCKNFISLRSCIEKRRQTKYEFCDGEIYNVTAVPFYVIDNDKEYMVSLELVSRLSNDMVLQANSIGPFSEKVELITRNMYEDSLTGVNNRRYFDEKRFLYKLDYNNLHRIGFLLIDVNRFKEVNDTYGHIIGDELLKAVASMLNTNINNENDSVIRIGGDEFLVVITGCEEADLKTKRQQLKCGADQIILKDCKKLRISLAVGEAYCGDFDGSQEQIKMLVAQADERMYKDKRTGY